MLSRLFFPKPTKAQTRLESHFEFNEVLKVFQQIVDKRDLLKVDANGTKMQAVSCSKYLIYKYLVDEIQSLVDEFNQGPVLENERLETKELVELVMKLEVVTRQVIDTRYNDLNTKRNDNKINAADAISTATTILPSALMFFSTCSVIAAAATYITTPTVVGDSINYSLSLTDKDAASLALIKHFYSILVITGKNLGMEDQWAKKASDAAGEPPEEFLCPIGKTIMSEPVICLLDNFTYERSNIERWLNENKISPITRAPLGDREVVSVLQPNKALKDLIESYSTGGFHYKNSRKIDSSSESITFKP